MEQIFYILAKSVEILLSLVSTCMFLRVILQLFVDTENNKLFLFCATVSEIFVTPFRYIMYKLNILQDTPIDAPFMVAYLVIMLLGMLLPII